MCVICVLYVVYMLFICFVLRFCLLWPPGGSWGLLWSQANRCSKKLFRNKFKNKKIALIQSFPVPNSKEDILEFLSLAIPLARKRGNFFTSGAFNTPTNTANKIFNEYVPVWHSKCQQIIMKARFSMKDDKKLLEEIEAYATELKIK